MIDVWSSLDHSDWLATIFNCLNIYIYIYIYKYVLFSPVKPESRIIPSGQKKKKSFNYEHINFPGKELNVTDITEQ